MLSRLKSSAGFTKIEVIVAGGCLLVIAALLLPLINDGSSYRRRSECAMRLGEIVKAFMLYEMDQKQYPGYLNAYGLDNEGMIKVGTWAVAVLPYIGEEPVYDTWADPSTTGQWNRRGGGSSSLNPDFFPNIKLFMCSSDENRGDGHAPCSFAVNAGFFPDILPPDYAGLDAHEIARRSSRPANGVFSNQLPAEINSIYTRQKTQRVLGSRADSPTRSADIRDGLTTTIAVTESRNADSWSQVGKDSDWKTIEIGGVTFVGDDLESDWSPRVRIGCVWQYKAQPPVKGVANYVAPNFNSGELKRTFKPELARPSSFHNGVFNAAMLGGSALSIDMGIDYRVLQSLMTPHTKKSDVPDRDYVLKEDDYY